MTIEFSEEQLLDAAENFVDADGRGEEAVAAEDAAGSDLAFGFEAAQADERRLLQHGVGLDLFGEHFAIRARGHGIDKDEVGLKPARGMQSELTVVFFFDPIFAGALQRAPDEAGDAGFTIDQQDFFWESHMRFEL